MIANFIVLGFVLLMGYWWGGQGLFSSLLHLVVVIVAGALAFAFWEFFTLTLLMPLIPTYAWSVGLLVPFLLFLFGGRLIADKMIKANMFFGPAINLTGGGVLGLISGVLTAGIMLIGIEFLPLGPSLLGYQPLVLDATGHVIDIRAPGAAAADQGGKLWYPVDTKTAGFFNYLSQGAFSSSTPLALYEPDVARQANIYRTDPDTDASLVATPASVTVTHFDTEMTPLKANVEDSVINLLGQDAKKEGSQLVVVDTLWQHNQPTGAYDSDDFIRVAYPQITLVSVPRSSPSGPAMLHQPLGSSQQAPGGARAYHPVSDPMVTLHAHGQPLTVAWVFLIPSDRVPVFLLARHLRLTLPKTSGPPDEIHALVSGFTPPPAEATGTTPTNPGTTTATGPQIGSPTGPNAGSMVVDAAISNKLPDAISKNMGTALTYSDNIVTAGDMRVKKFDGMPEQGILADRIAEASGTATIRLKLDRTKAESLLGAARLTAANLGGVWLEDSNSQQWMPYAYDIKKTDQSQIVRVGELIRSGKEIPVNEVEPGDELYLYFSVDKGTHITSYHMGESQQSLDLAVPK